MTDGVSPCVSDRERERGAGAGAGEKRELGRHARCRPRGKGSGSGRGGKKGKRAGLQWFRPEVSLKIFQDLTFLEKIISQINSK